MDKRVLKRQTGIIPTEKLALPITIIGLGGIGSWTAFGLAKMGCEQLKLIDQDTVEKHNSASQMHPISLSGETKTESLAKSIEDHTQIIPQVRACKWQDVLTVGEPLNTGIVISALDSMEERKSLASYFKSKGFPDLYLDGRMGGELFILFSVLGKDEATQKKYLESFEKNIKVHQEKCTERAIVYNTYMAAAIIINAVKRYANGEVNKYRTIADIGALRFY